MKLNDTVAGISQPWQNVGNVSVQPDKLSYTFSVTTGLVPDAEYNFRVDVVGMVYDKNMTQISMGTTTDILLNPCLSTYFCFKLNK